MENIEESVKDYLRKMWRVSNHAKYQKYFDEWYENLTNTQIYYFNKERINIKNGSLTKWDTKKRV